MFEIIVLLAIGLAIMIAVHNAMEKIESLMERE